ncbi:MAG: type II toxin-antitoxin system RelE/ParE family toxin [Verrucomicrobia subdivision 3 bacterium]|nr:type II toxin-antitoxin system RelE/ParE family toxin [Limisphaerales bacterium]
MADFTVSFARSARKELENLPNAIADRALGRIEKLATDPRPRGATKLRGQKNLWRIRTGDYRIIFSIDDKVEEIDITHIRHRRDVYRDI